MTWLLEILLHPFLIFFNCKLILRDWSLPLREIVALLLYSCIMVMSFYAVGMFAFPMAYVLFVLMGYRMKWGSLLPVAGVVSASYIIAIFSDYLVSSFEELLYGEELVHHFEELVFELSFFYIEHIFFTYLLSFLLTYVTVLFFLKIFETQLSDDTVRKLLSVTAIIVLCFFGISIYYARVHQDKLSLIQINLLFFVAFLIIFSTSVILWMRSLQNRMEAQKKEEERTALNFYIEQLEEQSRNSRKFRHDYKNLLLGLESYLYRKDYQGLEDYYNNTLQPTFSVTKQSKSGLNALADLHISELKSFLAVKLFFAEEKNTPCSLHLHTPIERIDVSRSDLVRLTGILFDNAQEELEEIGHGEMQLSLLQDHKATHIVLQNTCRPNIESLSLLKQEGFSTKGENRGLGLSILSDIIAKYDRLFLTTLVEEDQFVQKITVYHEL